MMNTTPPAEIKEQHSKICIVCGDKALGFNFNAISCESCKAFFRRNAISGKEFTCPFNSKCEITVLTRRFCQKCRLRKCLEIGMKKEYIMSEQDKKIKKEKIEQNRRKRKYKSTSGEEDELPIKKNVLVDYVNSTPEEVSIDNTSVKEMVDSIVNGRERISRFMKTKKDTLEVMEKIIKSPEDALTLISHLISNPADALVIIQKIMDSPFDALSVFNQFLFSTTDALSVISKIMSSPNEILNFMQQLMITPNKALDIMQKFVSSPSNHEEPSETNIFKTNLELGKSISDKLITFQNEANSINNDSIYCDSNSTCFTDSNNNGNISEEQSTTFRKMTSELTDEVLIDVQAFSDPKSSIASIISQAIKLEYDVTFTASKRSSRELSDTEQAKLNELIISNKALYQPVDDQFDLASLLSDECKVKSDPDQLDASRTSETLMNVINLTAVAIRRLIKMSKKISAFKNMCQECQIALLKAGCTEMMILRSVMQYDCDKASWKIPHSQEGMSSIKADVLKLAKGNVYEEHDRFIRSFDPKLKSDENVILILSAIVLFTPNRPKVIHEEVIRLEQNSYFYLLRRYLDSQYPNGCEAKAVFLKLIQKINELRKLNQEMISVYLDVDNPSNVEPLLREIFDLK